MVLLLAGVAQATTITLVANSSGSSGYKAKLAPENSFATTFNNTQVYSAWKYALTSAELDALSAVGSPYVLAPSVIDNSRDETIWVNFTLNNVISINSVTVSAYTRFSSGSDTRILGMYNATSPSGGGWTNLAQTTNGAYTWLNYTISSSADKSKYLISSGNTLTFSVAVWSNGNAGSITEADYYQAVVDYVPYTPPSYVPPVPINLQNSTNPAGCPSNCQITHTWQAGSGNVTNSYNVSMNGVWTNGSASASKTTTVSPHGWANISVWAFNGSQGNLSSSAVSQNTQMPNNVPIQQSIGNKQVFENATLSFTISTTDADNDVITYSTNASKGNLNTSTGVYSWTPAMGENGTYVWYFNSSDTYGGVASETITVTVSVFPTTRFEVRAGTTIKAGNDSLSSKGVTGGWVLAKGIGGGYSTLIPDNITGTYNVSVNLIDNFLVQSYDIRKNGVSIAGGASSGNGVETTFTHTISGVLNTTDTIELYIWVYSGGTLQYQWFRLKYDIWGNPTYNTTNTSEIITMYSVANQTNTSDIALPHSYNPQLINQFWANITSASTRSDPYQINTTGLVGWWHFDDNLNDKSGNGNNLTAYHDYMGNNNLFKGTLTNSPTWVNGQYGGGIQFDNIPTSNVQWLNATNSLSINGWNNISMGFRIKWITTPTATTEYPIGGKGCRDFFRKELGSGAGQDIGFYIYDGNPDYKSIKNTSGVNPTNNEWHTYIGIKNSTHLKLYKDGNSIASPVSASLPISDDSNVWNIGSIRECWSWSNGEYVLDDWFVYDREISSSEIAQISTGLQFPLNGLVMYFDFNETSGNTAYNTYPLNGSSYSKGKFNNITAFIDTKEYFSNRTNAMSNIPVGNSNYTLEGWFSITSLPTNPDIANIVAWGNAITNQSTALSIDYNGNIRNDWWDNDYAVSGGSIVGRPYYAVATYNGSYRCIYLDGNLLGCNNPTVAHNSILNNLRIGRSLGGLSLNGWIDEVRIYNRSKSADEIKLDYYTRLEQMRLKSDQTSTWSSYWNHSDNNSITIPYDGTGTVISTVQFNVPSSMSQNGINIYDYTNSSAFKINVTIDGGTTSSNLNYISPTKANASEAWNVRNTTIKIQTSSGTINNATLYWWSDNIVNHNVYNYSMNLDNSSVASYNFTNLIDDLYHYNVTVYVDGVKYVMPSKYVRIDLTLTTDKYLVFLYQNSTTSKYMSLKSGESVPSGWNLVEPEFYYVNTNNPSTFILYRCYNSTNDAYWDDTNCGVDSPTQLGKIYTVSNIHLVSLDRYVNGTKYVTVANRSAPNGYTFNKNLGYVMETVARPSNIQYINNSQIKIGFDILYGGGIVYFSQNGNNKSFINIFDTGREIQNAYYDGDGYNNVDQYYMDWNPLLVGSRWNEPSRVINYTISNNTATIITNASFWNPDHGNGLSSQLQITTTYSFDGENPVLIANYTYKNFDNINHTTFGQQEIPAIYTIGEFSKLYYHNSTQNIQVNLTQNQGQIVDSAIFVSALNNTGLGLGTWHWARPKVGLVNYSTTGTDTDIYANYGTQYIAPQVTFDVSANGTPNSTRTNIARIYFGNQSAMTSYFTALEFGVNFDPTTPTNQTVENKNYVNIKVNSTEIAKINNATLSWTNSTGTYYLSMTVDALNISASLNMTNLSWYNYTYSVTANATTGATNTTATVWTNLIDTLPPASITNFQTTIGNFYINNTFTPPLDGDYNYTWFRYSNMTTLQNVSNGTNHLQITYSPHYTQNISAQTVDTSGNVNVTLVWFNATIPNNPIVLSWVENQTVVVGQNITLYPEILDADNLDSDDVVFNDNSTQWQVANISNQYGEWQSNAARLAKIDWTSDTIQNYTWNVNASDGWGSTDQKNFTVTVLEPPVGTTFVTASSQIQRARNQTRRTNATAPYGLSTIQTLKNISGTVTITYEILWSNTRTIVQKNGINVTDEAIGNQGWGTYSVDISIALNYTDKITLLAWNETSAISSVRNFRLSYDEISYQLPVYNTGWQTILTNESTTLGSACSSLGASWCAYWNRTTQRFDTHKVGYPYKSSVAIDKGEAINAKFLSNSTLIRNMTGGNYYWNFNTTWALAGLEYAKTLQQINASVNNQGVCDASQVWYTKPDTQVQYSYTCGQAGNASVEVKQGEGVWLVANTNVSNRLRVW